MQLGQSSSLAVFYLSRLENDRITPTVWALAKTAVALGAPLMALFESEVILEVAATASGVSSAP